MITPAEQLALDEVFAYNPLLFDFVLKRTIRGVADSEALRLPQQLFFSYDFYRTPAPIAEGCWRDEM